MKEPKISICFRVSILIIDFDYGLRLILKTHNEIKQSDSIFNKESYRCAQNFYTKFISILEKMTMDTITVEPMFKCFVVSRLIHYWKKRQDTQKT